MRLSKSLPLLFLCLCVSCQNTETIKQAEPSPMPKEFTIPVIDLFGETHRQIVVDKEKSQYLGHPATVLLEDQKTMICVYPGLEVLPDGTFILTTYGHWIEGEEPFVVCVRLRLEELDREYGHRGQSEEMKE